MKYETDHEIAEIYSHQYKHANFRFLFSRVYELS